MQFPNDADLAAAIETSELIVESLVEIDWNRNGLYDHKYSDMSWLTTRVVDDMGPLSGDLPEEADDVSGFASSTLTVELGGVRYSDPDAQAAWSQALAEQGLTAVQFFDQYNPASPIVGKTVNGTPIRYSRVVSTAAGPRTIRQFTGWIRWPELDEGNQTVTLTAGDVEDLAGALVSFPVWAVGPGPDNDTQYNANGDFSANTPISAEWVYQECMRAAGRGIGPMPRPDAVAYWTCHGSWLPSVGRMGGPYPSPHNISVENTWKPLKYGVGHTFASWNDYGTNSGGQAQTPTLVDVPDRGSSEPNKTVGMAAWIKSDGGATAFGTYGVNLSLVLDDVSLGPPGTIQLYIYNNGSAAINVQESFVSGSPNAGAIRAWRYNLPLAAGLHYLAAHVKFTPTAITVDLYVDDVIISQTSSSGPTGGFKKTLTPRGAANRVLAIGGNVPCQHLQIYAGTTVTYDPNQKHPGWFLRGDPEPKFSTPTKSSLNWLPDVNNRGAWEVLKDVAAGELGTLHTNEFGRLDFVNFEAAWIPVYYGLDVYVKRRLTRDLVQNVRIRPSGDRYRNALSASWTQTQQIRKIVWQSPDARQFYEKVGSVHTVTIPLSDVSGIYQDFTSVSAAATPATPNLFGTQASAVRADSPGTGAPDGWIGAVEFAPDQRSLNVTTASGTSGAPVYVGAISGATAPNFTVGGWGLDTKKTTRQLYQANDPTHGTALLELPDSPWRQDSVLTFGIAYVTLQKTMAPLPLLDSITITADPRLQLRDFVIVEAAAGWYYCQIIGIRRTDGPEGSLDTLTLRLAATPNTWVLDDPGLSLLDSTTILA
ncbi:hypothetical protein VA596_49815 [Amycolatopsis sp., V23-08]|uniref:Minor tail protein n=1 Tax=Amycolatopsis heterodermiae TaxID=3110235 RepID=A0ABU5RN17_9PSEU|nr:hypothetical protein [Amycolatopsis sp., V23-08]MEA5367708.1 hypothetical protein [Amycolatopsis sp., V23-08]